MAESRVLTANAVWLAYCASMYSTQADIRFLLTHAIYFGASAVLRLQLLVASNLAQPSSFGDLKAQISGSEIPE